MRIVNTRFFLGVDECDSINIGIITRLSILRERTKVKNQRARERTLARREKEKELRWNDRKGL